MLFNLTFGNKEQVVITCSHISLIFSDWYIPSDSFSSRIGASAARKSQSKWAEHSSHYVSRLLCCYSAPPWWTDGHKHWPGISWSPERWGPTPRVPTSCSPLRVLRRVTMVWCVEGTIPGYLLFRLSPLSALEDSRPPTSSRIYETPVHTVTIWALDLNLQDLRRSLKLSNKLILGYNHVCFHIYT